MTSYGNCKALKDADADAPSGVYYFTINNQVVRVYCDMVTEGGGWMLVLNYVRGGGLTPNLKPRNSANGFPLLRSTRLGTDESWMHGVRSPWGHVERAALSQARARIAASAAHLRRVRPLCAAHRFAPRRALLGPALAVSSIGSSPRLPLPLPPALRPRARRSTSTRCASSAARRRTRPRC